MQVYVPRSLGPTVKLEKQYREKMQVIRTGSIYLKSLLVTVVESGDVILMEFIKFVAQFRLTCCPLRGQRTLEAVFAGHWLPDTPVMVPLKSEVASKNKIKSI